MITRSRGWVTYVSLLRISHGFGAICGIIQPNLWQRSPGVRPTCNWRPHHHRSCSMWHSKHTSDERPPVLEDCLWVAFKAVSFHRFDCIKYRFLFASLLEIIHTLLIEEVISWFSTLLSIYSSAITAICVGARFRCLWWRITHASLTTSIISLFSGFSLLQDGRLEINVQYFLLLFLVSSNVSLTAISFINATEIEQCRTKFGSLNNLYVVCWIPAERKRASANKDSFCF